MRIYGELLRERHAARLLGGTLLGRLPNGMSALAIVLLVRSDGGGYALAGLLSAVQGLGVAAGQPALSRLMDRTGQPRVLLGAALTAAAAYAALAAVGTRDVAPALALCLLAGLATPPLESGLRALWPSVLPPGRVQAAYALDAAFQEILFTLGPLIVVLVARFASEPVAVVLTGALGVAGTLVVATSRPSRAWRGEAHTPHWAGPLRSRGLRVLLAGLFFAGIALGVLGVAAVAYGDDHGSGMLAGIFMSAMSLGALTGGLVQGARTWARPPAARLPWLMAGLALGYAPLVWSPGPALMMVFAYVSGLFLAPAIACSFTIVDELAPHGTVTEAFAWVVTAIGAGTSAGAGIAGLAGQWSGQRAAFASAVVSAAAGFVVVLTGRRLLGRTVPAGAPAADTPATAVR